MQSPLLLLVTAAAAVIVATTAACTKDESPRAVADAAMQDYLGYVDQLGVVLGRIKNEKTAKASVGEISDIAAAMARVKAKIDGSSARVRDRLEYRYHDQLRDARRRVNEEAVRLMSKRDTALVLREPMAPVTSLIR